MQTSRLKGSASPLYPVHPDEVINECRRRIEAIYPPTVQTVVMLGGGEAMQRMAAVIQCLRARSEELLAMSPIPHQYRSDHYWHVPNVIPSIVAGAAAVAAPAAPNPITIVMPQMPPQPQVQQQPVIVQMPSHPVQVAAPQPLPALYPAPAAAPAPPPQIAAPRPASVPAAHSPASAAASRPAQLAAPRAASAPDGSRSDAPPIGVEIDGEVLWSEGSERLYRLCIQALEGHGGAVKTIADLAERERIPMRSFAERVISERARTVAVFSRMQAAR